MERNKRKVLVGKVVSTKSTKTIIVAVETYNSHPLYHKRYKSTRKFAAHDQSESAKDGDRVQIAETRKLSKTKNFRLVKILETNKDGE